MDRTIVAIIVFAAAAGAQTPGSGAEEARQRLAAVNESIGRSEAALRGYSWTESVEVSVKGKVKNVQQKECRYGSDGNLVESPGGSTGGNGLNDELRDYLDRAGSLTRRYMPPDPDAMKAALDAGKASLDSESGTLTFMDYAKPGDRATLAYDKATNRVRSWEVTTYLNDRSDRVDFNAQFSTLPDGANHLEQWLLDARVKQVRIKTTNFGYTK